MWDQVVNLAFPFLRFNSTSSTRSRPGSYKMSSPDRCVRRDLVSKSDPPIKRELPNATSMSSEEPAQKRAKFFIAIQSQITSSQPRIIRCVDDLNEVDLEECHCIATNAMKAMSPEYQFSPHVTEAFLQDIFQNQWKPGPIEKIPDVLHLPLKQEKILQLSSRVGTVTIRKQQLFMQTRQSRTDLLTGVGKHYSRRSRDVHFLVEVHPRKATATTSLVHSDEIPIDPKHLPVDWLSDEIVQLAQCQTLQQIMEVITSDFKEYNRHRAIQYGRLAISTKIKRMPLGQTTYRFANLDSLLRSLPFLNLRYESGLVRNVPVLFGNMAAILGTGDKTGCNRDRN